MSTTTSPASAPSKNEQPDGSSTPPAGSRYSGVAVGVFNSLLLLVIANLALWVVFRARDGGEKPLFLVQKYGIPTLQQAYRMPEADLLTLLRENESSLYMEHEQFTEFRPRQVNGRYVNISEHGFRHVPGQAPWPIDTAAVNVFMFGGSTTFGLNVADGETVPAYLQARLRAGGCTQPVHVYNFGRHWYFSLQERLLFERLLLAGHVPDVALFLDGLNDFATAHGVTYTAPRFAQFMDQANRPKGSGYFFGAFLQSLPMARAAQSVAGRLEVQAPPPPPSGDALLSDEAFADTVIHRWLANKRLTEAVADDYGVRPVFVWQPVPTYGYDLQHHYLNGKESFDDLKRHGPGYARMDAARASDPRLQSNFLWLADLQRGSTENLYVDKAHYTGAFASRVASEMYDHLVRAELVPCSAGAGE